MTYREQLIKNILEHNEKLKKLPFDELSTGTLEHIWFEYEMESLKKEGAKNEWSTRQSKKKIWQRKHSCSNNQIKQENRRRHLGIVEDQKQQARIYKRSYKKRYKKRLGVKT